MNEQTFAIDTKLQAALADVTRKGLSPVARIAHVALLLAALAMSIILASLLITEPGLPARTQTSFAAMLLMSLAWVSYAIWALQARLALLARHRVIAASMGIAFSSVFSLTASGVYLVTSAPAAAFAAANGALMWVAALVLLVRARRRQQALQQRRDHLQQQLGGLAG